MSSLLAVGADSGAAAISLVSSARGEDSGCAAASLAPGVAVASGLVINAVDSFAPVVAGGTNTRAPTDASATNAPGENGRLELGRGTRNGTLGRGARSGGSAGAPALSRVGSMSPGAGATAVASSLPLSRTF